MTRKCNRCRDEFEVLKWGTSSYSSLNVCPKCKRDEMATKGKLTDWRLNFYEIALKIIQNDRRTT